MRRSAELAKDRALQMLAEKRGECPFKTSCSTSTAHFQKDLTLADEKLMVMLSYRSGISWLKTPRKGETRKGNVSTKRKRAVLLHPRKSNREKKVCFSRKCWRTTPVTPTFAFFEDNMNFTAQHSELMKFMQESPEMRTAASGSMKQVRTGRRRQRVLERNPN